MSPTRASVVVAALCAMVAWAGCSSSSSPAAGGGDSGAVDAGSDAPLLCPPSGLGTWQPPAYHHAEPAEPTACTAALIADFYASCLGPSSSSSACNQSWGASTQDPAHLACQTCLVTASTTASWGPLVNYGNTVSLNVAGCIELSDPSQLACATAVQDVDECEHQVCDPLCPVTDDASFANWKACTGAAATGVCSSYVSGAACQAAFADAGPASPCVSATTFQDEFTAIAAVFCSK